MRAQPRALLALSAISVALAACSDRQSPTPTAPTRTPTAASAALEPFSTACNTVQLKSDARDLAASNQDVLLTIVGNLQKSINQSGLNPSATGLAFDGLARLAVMRGTSAIKSTATNAGFNAVTRGFIGCMEPYITGTVDNSFSVTGALGPGWMYEVRGGATDSTGGAYERGTFPDKYWAAEAPSGWSASTNPTGTRFLIYGYHIDNFANDPAVSAFEIKTVPAIGLTTFSFSSPLEIGLCNYNPSPTVRVQHNNDVLVKQGLLCADPASFSGTLASLGLRGLGSYALGRVADFLGPKPAYAFGFGGVGGAVSELSPSAVIDLQSVQLAFVKPVADGQVSLPLADADGNPIQVRATTQGGTPLAGVSIVLSIYGNSSSIAYFRQGTDTSASVTRTTGPDGVATFDNPPVYLTKAGGYTLVVVGTFDPANPITSAQFLSNSFNYQNK